MTVAPSPLMVLVLSQPPYTSKPDAAPRRAATSSPTTKAVRNSLPLACTRSAAAKAVGRARGIGTVNVVIATHAGVPDAALLAAVETDLQKKREIAVDVKVLAPTVETVAVTAALKAAPGYTFAEAKAGAQSALEALFTGELLGKSVTTARLLTLLCGVEGVENVHLTAPAADVAVGSTELPMLGTVTISELTEA